MDECYPQLSREHPGSKALLYASDASFDAAKQDLRLRLESRAALSPKALLDVHERYPGLRRLTVEGGGVRPNILRWLPKSLQWLTLDRCDVNELGFLDALNAYFGDGGGTSRTAVPAERPPLNWVELSFDPREEVSTPNRRLLRLLEWAVLRWSATDMTQLELIDAGGDSVLAYSRTDAPRTSRMRAVEFATAIKRWNCGGWLDFQVRSVRFQVFREERLACIKVHLGERLEFDPLFDDIQQTIF